MPCAWCRLQPSGTLSCHCLLTSKRAAIPASLCTTRRQLPIFVQVCTLAVAMGEPWMSLLSTVLHLASAHVITCTYISCATVHIHA